MTGDVATSSGMDLTLYDFTAAWCAPCKQLTPVLHELATDYRGRATIVEIDVEREPALAQAFKVTAMPTLVLVREGREVGRVVGLRPKKFIAGMLDRALEGHTAIASP